MYKDCKYNKSSVAAIIGVSPSAVSSFMKKRGIKTIPKPEPISKAALYSYYVSKKMSVNEISNIVGIPRGPLWRLMKKYKIPIRAFEEGNLLYYEMHPNVRSERNHPPMSEINIQKARERIIRANSMKAKKMVRISENGYWVFTCGPNKGRCVHTVIMEEHIGRHIRKGECVHHINGNRTDNRIENLQLLTIGEHTKLHNPSNSGSRKMTAPGERSPRAKLTIEQVREIREHPEVSNMAFAQKFNVTDCTISAIRLYKTWKNI